MTAPRKPVSRAPLRADRLRRTDQRGFAFIPNRFLHDGFFASLGDSERSLYFFLVLAGDRDGISFYSYDRICSILALTLDDYLAARQSLVQKDLLAFDGKRFQVLSLPAKPVTVTRQPLSSQEDLDRHDPATIRHILRDSFREP